ncbi:hypothetical protein EV702DRAFT_1075151, partial [Suillus placidus]
MRCILSSSISAQLLATTGLTRDRFTFELHLRHFGIASETPGLSMCPFFRYIWGSQLRSMGPTGSRRCTWSYM